MLCCLNPDCDRPINPDGHVHCQNCGVPVVALLYNRFKVIEPIGRGGFGKTYLAEDTHKLNDRCVVKQLAYRGQGTLAIQQKVVQLFEQEAKQLQELGENPQIPTLLAYFEEAGYLYLVQQFIEGDNLLKQLEKQGKFSEAQIQQLLLDLLPILQFVHDRGTIHRDIKPENIMRRAKDGKPILIDFGVAKLLSQTVVAVSSVGTSLGSHGYSPPEQIKEGKAVYASDLFALGATCFHLMSGIHPFYLWTDYGYSWITNWRQHLPNPISAQLGAVLDKLLQKDVGNRYQSANAVLQDLQPKPPISPTVPLPNPPISPTVPISPTIPISPRSFNEIDPSHSQSRKGLMTKLAWLFGIGFICVAIANGLKGNNPKVDSLSSPKSSTPEASPTSQLTAKELFELADKKSSGGDKQGSIADYTKAIELDPKYTDAYNNRGTDRAALGDNQGAIADYTKAIELNPKYVNAYNNRGTSRSALGDKQGAIADFTKAIEIDPKYFLPYFNRAIDFIALGDTQGALADYNKAIELNPKYVLAYNNRGNTRFDLGDKQAAIADYTKAIELDPDYVQPIYKRGNARFDLGDKQGAIADFNKAIELDPKYTDAYYNRGNAHASLDNKPEAIRDFQKAADLYFKEGKTKGYQDALNRLKKLQQH